MYVLEFYNVWSNYTSWLGIRGLQLIIYYSESTTKNLQFVTYVPGSKIYIVVPKTYGLTCAVYVLEPKAWKLYYALKYMAQNPNTTMCFVFVKIIDTTLFWVTFG